MKEDPEILKRMFLAQDAEQKKSAPVRREAVAAFRGSIPAFLSGLCITCVDDPAGADFDRAYDFYSGFFTLEDELESKDGFRAAMEFNFSEAHQRKFGPFAEQWLLVDTPEGGQAAGINFCMYTMPENIVSGTGIHGSAHISYIFVARKYRNMGVAEHLIQLAYRHISRWIADRAGVADPKTLITCEQNAPELMTALEYFTDCIHSGTDQCDRLMWWDRRGYKRLAFNYTQPALSPDSEPCTTLTLNVLAQGMEHVAGKLLYEHLRRFFEMSVFKGDDPESDPYFKRLSKYLLETEQVGLSGSVEYYEGLKEICYSPGYTPSGRPLFSEP